MKIRTGHVSNSSSSSFIVAIGKIIDSDKFTAFLSQFDMRVMDGFKLMSPTEFLNREDYDAKLINSRDAEGNSTQTFSVESFSTSVSMSAKEYVEADSKKDPISAALGSLAGNSVNDIVVWNYAGDEGDVDPFVKTDENGDFLEMDYDIDLSYFDREMQELYRGLTEENGVVLVNKTFGAARNG